MGFMMQEELTGAAHYQLHSTKEWLLRIKNQDRDNRRRYANSNSYLHRRALWTAFSQEGGKGKWEGEDPAKWMFFAITWIRFIGSRQNLAWTYYLTLGTSLRKNFSFFSKSKMAAGGQKFATRYTFFPRPMFSRLRNAMKLSFAFYDLSNYLKIQNGRRNWRF